MVLGFGARPSLERGHPAKREGDLVPETSEQNPQSLRDSSFTKELTERYVSSDYRALIGLIEDYVILEDGDIFLMTPEEYTILSEDRTVDRELHTIDEAEKPAELGDFEHFMLKEIYDQ